jgi:hypothetical protein
MSVVQEFFQTAFFQASLHCIAPVGSEFGHACLKIFLIPRHPNSNVPSAFAIKSGTAALGRKVQASSPQIKEKRTRK